MKRVGWIVSDGQTFRLRTLPKRYGGAVLVEQRVTEAAVLAFDRVEPGELPCADPAVRPGSVDDMGRWTLISGRQVWP
jgi:hypothetical protein